MVTFAAEKTIRFMSHFIAPSVLSANFLNLDADIDMINRSEADWFHVDVMDGVFVPNISFGFPVLKALQKTAKKPLDVHLMIVDPDKFIPAFKDAGAAVVSVHIEACTHLHRTVQNIHQLDMKAGVAVNPHTPISQLEDIITDVDLVCLMSVNPGFGGQKFIENTYEKVKRLKQLIQQKNSKALIEIDGGVDLNNYKKLVDCGANVLVAGNTVFSSADPASTIRQLKTI
jgi:ribulose-phosphate 3-epimerase